MGETNCTTKNFPGFLIAVFLVIAGCLHLFEVLAYAKESSFVINGSLYEFDKNAHYEFSSTSASSGNALGTLAILGDLDSADSRNGFPSYSVNSESVSFCYSYSQSQLNAAETEWHLIDDKTKKVDSVSLDKNILSGALIVQSSKDGENWITDVTMTDVFSSDSNSSDTIYTTNGIQLENGCCYRVIAAYKLQRKVGESKVLFIDKNTTEEKKIAEVYEFYAVSSEAVGNTASAAAAPRKELGRKVRTELDKGYSGNIEIDKNDPHYGWNLGTFAVNGYTREIANGENSIFLKNVGDKVTLWFTLTENINELNGKRALAISQDTNGYDQYFEIGQTDFKRGALIIRYTDYEGNIHEPVVYTDFLAANAVTGTDTRVRLFEEGDYEVALDYEIKNNPRQIGPVSIIPTYANYKISFGFSIRNGNCMVYPFDTATGAELSNNAVSSNGFKLDMAKSRYLTIDVKRTVLNEGADGLLIEDVRFNRPAKDNDSYTDEGIYNFTVKNLYTGETTAKTIYVGTDKYLLALSKNMLTVETLNGKIAQGAVIYNDGTIADYVPEIEPELSAPGEIVPQFSLAADTLAENPVEDVSSPDADNLSQNSFPMLSVIAVLAVIMVITIAAKVSMKKNKEKKME